jgi:hypothetical protein
MKSQVKVNRLLIPLFSGIMAVNVVMQYPHFVVIVLAAFMFYLACLSQYLIDMLKENRDLSNQILKDWKAESDYWMSEMRAILNRCPDASKLFVQRNENRESLWEN